MSQKSFELLGISIGSSLKLLELLQIVKIKGSKILGRGAGHLSSLAVDGRKQAKESIRVGSFLRVVDDRGGRVDPYGAVGARVERSLRGDVLNHNEII